MKLLNNLFLFIVILSTVFAQSKDLALEYERATKLTNANEALQIYQRIINTNEDSEVPKGVLFSDLPLFRILLD